MKILVSLFSIYLLTLSSCSRDGDCDCGLPPVTETNWKMTKIFGGFAGEERQLNDDQRNSILTIKSNGSYSCKNTVTGQISNGTITATTGNILIKYTFNPKLRIYPASSFWLNEKTNTTMVLGEVNPDGYWLTFTIQ